jgi:nucleolin
MTLPYASDLEAKKKAATKKPVASKTDAKKAKDSDEESSDDSDEVHSYSVPSKDFADPCYQDSDVEMAAPTSQASKKRKPDESPAKVDPKKAKVEDGGEIRQVFVGGLSWNVDDEWLQKEFEGCGEVISARVITDRDTGRSRGCVFFLFHWY